MVLPDLKLVFFNDPVQSVANGGLKGSARSEVDGGSEFDGGSGGLV